MKTLYLIIGSILPKTILKIIQTKLDQAGINQYAKSWIGKIIFTALSIALLTNLILVKEIKTLIHIQDVPNIYLILIPLSILILIPLLHYIKLISKIAYRTEKAEEIFPDFLFLMASNIQGGMNPFEAFFASARKDMEVLGEESQRTKKMIISGGSVASAFRELSKRLDSFYITNFSIIFQRAVLSGARVVDVIQEYAENIREMTMLKKDVVSQVSSNIAFIAFITIILLPILLSLTNRYIEIYRDFSEKFTDIKDKTENTTFNVSEILITSEELLLLSYIFLIISSLNASMLIGVIRSGKMVKGLKYFIPLLLITSVLFTVSLHALAQIIKI